MKFKTPLIRATLVQRYKRFLADVVLDDGTTLTATCPNTGTMMGLTAPGSPVWLSKSDSLTRKYAHTWEMIENDLGAGPSLVGINTGHPNAIVSEAVSAGKVKELKGYASQRREVKYGASSRIDILLEDPAKGLAYVEIKNVHLMRKVGLAEFPDCVTERGVKHLEEMTAMIKAGHRAVMVYLIQRADAKKFTIATDLDPTYGKALDKARAAGVEAIAYRCNLSLDGIVLDKAVPMV